MLEAKIHVDLMTLRAQGILPSALNRGLVDNSYEPGDHIHSIYEHCDLDGHNHNHEEDTECEIKMDFIIFKHDSTIISISQIINIIMCLTSV